MVYLVGIDVGAGVVRGTRGNGTLISGSVDEAGGEEEEEEEDGTEACFVLNGCVGEYRKEGRIVWLGCIG